MRKIYVDLDGVLADFDTGFKLACGQSLEEVGDANIWNVLRPHADGFYAGLPLMPDAKLLWHHLHKSNFVDIQILSAIPRRAQFPTAERDKRIWVAKHFGPDVRVNMGPFAVDKQNWCRPGDILIDDSEKNIPQWRSKGGVGILHTSGVTTIQELMTMNLQGDFE